MQQIKPPLVPGYKNWHQKHEDQMSRSDKIADKVTGFAGTMRFLYLHFVWWAFWFVINANFLRITFDKYPYGLLTMILSLEAIVLATLIMISQNRQESRDKTQAEHQYKHQEMELKENTLLTEEVHKLSKAIHDHISVPKQKRDQNGRFRR